MNTLDAVPKQSGSWYLQQGHGHPQQFCELVALGHGLCTKLPLGGWKNIGGGYWLGIFVENC